MGHICLGKCASLFLLAVVFDAAGLLVLLFGIFGDLSSSGRFYGDFLIYTGSIVIFLSLMWWVLWYTVNVQLFMEERPVSFDIGFTYWTKKLSERLSKSAESPLGGVGEKMNKSAGNGRRCAKMCAVPGRVTWEDSGSVSGQYNGGFDGGTESANKNVELGLLEVSVVAP
ncbi:transmembrane protein 238-like [Takifugu flavidus]|uniref:transmembrane protein 238-like n=1 Tax=Takifugu flavidus TaxID=433684 RepID=UPI0025441649|nr:transmembrane protein 238-like [Takifugu flavidus]